MTPEASRVQVLAIDFETRGLDADAARSLSFELALRYPVSARLGLTDLARRLVNRGLDDEAALDAALAICTVEMLDRGAEFNAVLSNLRRVCTDPGAAYAGALRGSQLHRCMAESAIGEDELSRVTIIALAGLTVATLLFTVWMRFAI